MRQTSLCLLLKEQEILLAMKKAGFGKGKWNGYGGKPLSGEAIEQTALREMEEEIGVKVEFQDLEKVGRMEFYFQHKPEWNQEVIVFVAKKWSGEPIESEEMRPQWFKFSKIPFDQMWPDDKYWIPKLLTGRKFEGEFYFNEDSTNFEKFRLKEVDHV